MNAISRCVVRNTLDHDGNPAGGSVRGVGIFIDWQDGPLGPQGPNRSEPNGAFVETIINAALLRLQFYQSVIGGKFKSQFNEGAIEHLQAALTALEARTADRERRKVEGTHVS